jgi:hypothetical protein
VSANEHAHAIDLKQTEPADGLAQLCRADVAATERGAEALCRKRDATRFGGG